MEPHVPWTYQKIRVYAFYCVLALTLSPLLRRRLAKAGIGMNRAAFLEQLSGIYEVAHIYPPQARKKDTFTLSEMNELQRELAQIPRPWSCRCNGWRVMLATGFQGRKPLCHPCFSFSLIA